MLFRSEIQLGAVTLTTPPTAKYLRSRNLGDARYRPVGAKNGVFLPNQSGLVRAFKRYNRSIAAAGTTTVQDVPRTGMLCALHIVHDGNTSAAELRFGGMTQYKGASADISALQNGYGAAVGRTTQSNVISIDFLIGNSPGGIVVLDGQTPDLILTTTAASTIRLYWELLAQPSEL